jgi:hypothetical protein
MPRQLRSWLTDWPGLALGIILITTYPVGYLFGHLSSEAQHLVIGCGYAMLVMLSTAIFRLKKRLQSVKPDSSTPLVDH